MKSDLVYLQQVWFTTSRYGELKTGKITALGKSLFTINGKYVYHTDTMKEKDSSYSSGKCYLKVQDYYDEKEYKKNIDFLKRLQWSYDTELTLDQTRRIIDIMCEGKQGA